MEALQKASAGQFLFPPQPGPYAGYHQRNYVSKVKSGNYYLKKLCHRDILGDLEKNGLLLEIQVQLVFLSTKEGVTIQVLT